MNLNIHIDTHTHGLCAMWPSSVENMNGWLHEQPRDWRLWGGEVTAAGPPVKLHAGGQRALLFPQMENCGFMFRRCRRNNGGREGGGGERSYLPSGVLCCQSLFAVTTLLCLLMKTLAMGADTCRCNTLTFLIAFGLRRNTKSMDRI